MNEPLSNAETFLREIRDLLSVLAEAAFPEYQAAALARLGTVATTVRQLVNTPAQWEALALMDGTRSPAVVAAETKIDPSNLRKFIARWKDGGFVVDGAQGPRSTLSPLELRAVRSSS